MDIINPYIHGGESVAFDGFGNRSRSLDGSSDYISIPDINESTTNLSVALWLKTTDLNWTTSHLAHWKNAGNNRAWNIGPSKTSDTNGKKLMIYLSADGDGLNPIKRYYGTTDVSDGTWHHVAFTWDNGTLKLFVDGSEETTIKEVDHSMTTILNSDGLITVGCTFANGVPANFGSGGRADIRIYNSTLTATDISDIYNGTNITTNLVGHWLTDADNLLDAAGTNHGTNYGTKYSYDNPSPPVEFGRASRSFDGVDDTINLGQTADNAIFSVSSWFKLNTVNSNGSGIIGKWHNNTSASWLLYVRSASSSGNMTFIVRNGADNGHSILDSGVSASSLIGEWTYIVGVADGNNLTMYINGVSVASRSYDGTINNPASDAHIGSYNADINNNHRTNGKIADVRIYDAELTASQISDLYAGTDVQTNLIGHWLTDNDDVEDKAGTNDGTNFGSVYSYDNPPMDLIPFGQRSRTFTGDYINTNTGFQSVFQSSFSISTWVRFDEGNPSAAQAIFGNQSATPVSRVLIFLDTSGGLTFSYFANGIQARAEIDQNFANGDTGWFHYTAVVEPTGITIYKDGFVQTLDATDDGDMSAVTMGDYGTDIDCYIGARNFNGSTDLKMNGNIADFRIYDSALSASDVTKIYNRTDDKSNIHAWYLTNSDDVLDHAGTNDGTNFGSTYSTDSPS